MAKVWVPRNPTSVLDPTKHPDPALSQTDSYNIRFLALRRNLYNFAHEMKLQRSTTGTAFGTLTATPTVETTRKTDSPDKTENVALTTSKKSPPLANDDESEAKSPEQVPTNVALDSREGGDLSSIIQGLRESVVIKDMPIKNSRWVNVPRGYLVDLEIRPARHYKIKYNVKAHVKKRKREASPSKPFQRGWWEETQGFRPEEMIGNGALGYKSHESYKSDLSTLTNKIHPLFDRSSFDDTPDAIYDQLIPGLQLATLFLTQPSCMQFWATLAMGKRKHDPEMSAFNGRPAQRIDTHVELTEERAKTVIELIDSIGKAKLIHFRFKSRLQTLTNSKEIDSAFAISAPICDYKALDSECHTTTTTTNRKIVRSIIRFHSDYYIIAKKLSQLKYPDPAQVLRFNFGFAVLLLHELAHSIEGIHFRARTEQWLDFHQHAGYYREPYWLDWNESELGRAWEQTIFGGHLQPTNGRVDGSHGIAVADWPFGESAREPSPESHRWWSVGMDYVSWIFRKETWEKARDLRTERGWLRVPRMGATSLCINSFTTMRPDEEWRVAREEARALGREEPARKKRVKALGEVEETRVVVPEIVAGGSGNGAGVVSVEEEEDFLPSLDCTCCPGGGS